MPPTATPGSLRDRLHRLTEILPDAELDTAARVLEALAAHADPVALACALAPEDDERLTDADRAALAERARTEPGAYVSLDAAMADIASGEHSVDGGR